MGSDRDDWIAGRAYQIWEEEGQPDGAHAEHWHRAEAEYETLVCNRRPMDMWACKEQPQTRLVAFKDSDLPAELGARDWVRIGTFEGGAEIAQQVAAKGYAFFDTDEAMPDPDSLKNDGVSGA